MMILEYQLAPASVAGPLIRARLTFLENRLDDLVGNFALNNRPSNGVRPTLHDFFQDDHRHVTAIAREKPDNQVS